MSPTRQRASVVLGGLLLLALAAFVFIAGRGLTGGAPPSAQPTRPPTAIPPSPTPPRAEGALAVLPTIDPTLAAIDRPTLTQEWAAAIIQETTMRLDAASQPVSEDDAWLRTRGLWGTLSGDNGGVMIGDQPLLTGDRQTIDIQLADPAQPGRLLTLGRVERTQTTLILHLAADDQSVRTISGDATPGDALRALVEESTARDIALVAAYWDTPGKGAVLALAEAHSLSQPAQATAATPPPTTTTPTPATATTTPSPTLVYQTAIHRTVETGLLPFVEDTQQSNGGEPPSPQYLRQQYARVGVLTWDSESSEPLVDGLPLALGAESARQMTVFRLTGQEDSFKSTKVLEASWDGDGTTITAGASTQWYYGFRVPEVVHWLITVAEENGGQLTVAYDAIGDYRAITVVDLQPLPLPPAS